MKLVPTRGSTALAVQPSGILSATAPVLEGIKDLMVGFAAPSREDEDTKRLIRLFVEAVAGFHELIAIEAVHELRFNNPRNPYRPSPQDVYERCKRIEKELRTKITDYFIGWSDAGWPAKWGGAPLTIDCHIPDALIEYSRSASRTRTSASTAISSA